MKYSCVFNVKNKEEKIYFPQEWPGLHLLKILQLGSGQIKKKVLELRAGLRSACLAQASAGGCRPQRGSGYFISFSTPPPTGAAGNSTSWCCPDALKRKTFRTIALLFFLSFFFFSFLFISILSKSRTKVYTGVANAGPTHNNTHTVFKYKGIIFFYSRPTPDRPSQT